MARISMLVLLLLSERSYDFGLILILKYYTISYAIIITHNSYVRVSNSFKSLTDFGNC